MPGRYEVVGTLAAGGMAEILLGRAAGPEGFARAVALKRVLPHLAKQPAFRTMFLDEARIMAGIHHSNVVNVHELYEEDDELFLVMDYLEGETAASLLRASVASDRTLPAHLMAYVVAEACAGLHAAHEVTDAEGNPLGLVHRDVSPQNVFITYDGHVLLLDFGIAHAAGRGTHTEAGQIKGKFAYMSPEQCRGKVLDRRSDVFALGILLYELTTSRHLFKRESDMRTMRAVCKEPVVEPGSLVAGYPRTLAAIALQALDKDRDRRPATAAALEEALRKEVTAPNPRAELAELMEELFRDRIDEKGEMLRALRTPSSAIEVAEAETHVGVTVPTVPDRSRDIEDTDIATRQPKRWPLWVAAITLAAGAGVYALSSLRTEPAPAQSATSSRGATAAVVRLQLETTPVGARVQIDGVPVGTTPLDHELPASETPVTVVVALAGFEPLTEEVVPNVSQLLRLTLNPAAPSTAETSGSAGGGAAVSPSGRQATGAAGSAETKPPVPSPVIPHKRPTPTPPPLPSAKSKYYQL